MKKLYLTNPKFKIGDEVMATYISGVASISGTEKDNYVTYGTIGGALFCAGVKEPYWKYSVTIPNSHVLWAGEQSITKKFKKGDYITI